MRALILSDIHGNLEALEAVLTAAAKDGGYDQLWNLGDMVGYGGSPNQVLDRIRPLSTLVVRGNHDRVCCGLTSPNNFNPVARAAALWTRAELTLENLDWLTKLPQGPVATEVQEVSCVHGSPLNEDQYILTMRDAWAPLQQGGAALTFFGHTHLQGGFSQREHDWHELRPRYPGPVEPKRFESRADIRALDPRHQPAAWVLPLLEGTRHLINPGSVGQPRDHDWRAAFAIYDTVAARITFRRVPYDVVTSQGRILMAGLPERLAARLREGR
jgi:diadenosine tetraphosphatase ApaH/serine/threonine PP2A family protein phosphatase